jgi:nucleotide-binding universal stress UspA family protein
MPSWTALRRADGTIECTTMIDEGDLLGSVPNSVTHKAPCSVYVVKTT